MATGDLINADSVVVRFGEHLVLDGISLSLQPDEILVLAGGSGCGKTTLLRHLVGLRAPDGGSVRLFGRDLYQLPLEEQAETLKRIGMLFQGGALFNSLSIEDNVAMPLIEHRAFEPEVARLVARMKLALVGLENSATLLPGEISGGMKKRAGLARALALDPEVLLFDEPSAGLDPVTARALDDLILNLKERLRVGMIVVSHELGSIETIADRVIILDRGHIAAQGTLEEVRASADPMVQAFFARRARTDSDGVARPIAQLLRVTGESSGG